MPSPGEEGPLLTIVARNRGDCAGPHPATPAAPLTLQTVELARAVLAGDVLPVGAARQGHHGAQRGRPLAHLHLELWSKEKEWFVSSAGVQSALPGEGSGTLGAPELWKELRHMPR